MTGRSPVRAMAVYALGLRTDVASLAAVRQLLGTDPSSAVRYAAADAIGRIALAYPAAATEDTAHALLAAAGGDADSFVRGHAAANLDAFAARPFAAKVVRRLWNEFARERNPVVRWHLMWVLGRSYAQLCRLADLATALRDSDEYVRAEAVRALGKKPGSQAETMVRPMLRDRSWHVQFDAREALRRLAAAAPTAHLTAMPPGIHLPPIPPPARHLENGGARRKPRAPAPHDVPAAPALDPGAASQMDGPMPGLHPRVRIETTKGDVVVRLYPEWAPLTVANFLNLAAGRYYDGNRFFRIVPDFVVQTGDPNDDRGNGDAGYHLRTEINPIEQRAGILAMALNYDKHKHADRDSGGTEFYITLSPQLHLDRDFTVFGEVESGFNVLAHLIESDRMIHLERIAPD